MPGPRPCCVESELELLQRRNRELEQKLAEQSELLSLGEQNATGCARAEELLGGEAHLLELIATGAPLRETLTALARTMEAQLPGSLCSIILLDEDGKHLGFGAAPGLPEDDTASVEGMALGPEACLCGTAALSGKRTIVTEIADDPR